MKLKRMALASLPVTHKLCEVKFAKQISKVDAKRYKNT
jgi:hypothetical protein